MNRQVKIYRCLVEVEDPITEIILKYGQTPKELYMESADFRLIFSILTNQVDSKVFGIPINISGSEINFCIPFDDYHKKHYESEIEHLADELYELEDFLCMKWNCWEKENEFIVSQYHSIMKNGRRLDEHITLDDIFFIEGSYTKVHYNFMEIYEANKKMYDKLR